MNTEYSSTADYDLWLNLAREVEPLFGPMADEEAFQIALKQSIENKTLFASI